GATVTDPYGHGWLLQAPLPGAVAEPAGEAESGAAPLRQGDISYVSLWVPDVARAAAFYGAVLGLEYLPAHEQRGRQAPGSAPPQGLWEVADGPAAVLFFVVGATPPGRAGGRPRRGRGAGPRGGRPGRGAGVPALRADRRVRGRRRRAVRAAPAVGGLARSSAAAGPPAGA